MAQSQQEYLDSLKQHAAGAPGGVASGANKRSASPQASTSNAPMTTSPWDQPAMDS